MPAYVHRNCIQLFPFHFSAKHWNGHYQVLVWLVEPNALLHASLIWLRSLCLSCKTVHFTTSSHLWSCGWRDNNHLLEKSLKGWPHCSRWKVGFKTEWKNSWGQHCEVIVNIEACQTCWAVAGCIMASDFIKVFCRGNLTDGQLKHTVIDVVTVDVANIIMTSISTYFNINKRMRLPISLIVFISVLLAFEITPFYSVQNNYMALNSILIF